MTILNELTAVTPLDGRYAEVARRLRETTSEYGLMKFRLIVEVKWLIHLSEIKQLPEVPELSQQSIDFLNSLIENFDISAAERIKAIECETNHDVKSLEYYLKERLDEVEELKAVKEFVHFGCTSEDINNLAYGLMIKSTLNYCILPELDKILTGFTARAHMHAINAMLSHTHGQPASPTTVGKEFANFSYRLDRQIKRLLEVKFLGKLNGAVGNYNALVVSYPEINWPKECEAFVTQKLELSWNPYTTQIEPHDYIAEICSTLHLCNCLLIDFSKDMWSYISRGIFILKRKESEVGSSTMPHKVNPIDFENAEGNLGLANSLLGFFSTKLPISRMQRDLSDSTVMRNIGLAFGYCLIAYRSIDRGLQKLEVDHTFMEALLNRHWEVLAEALQMIMRRHNIEKPYEKLKALTRGKTVTQEDLHQFVDALELPDEVKETMKALSPTDYIGYAATLAKDV